MGHVHEFVLTRPDAFADPLRKHAIHQTARTACRATAGHIRTPTSLTPAAAFARTAPAAQLYSSREQRAACAARSIIARQPAGAAQREQRCAGDAAYDQSGR